MGPLVVAQHLEHRGAQRPLGQGQQVVGQPSRFTPGLPRGPLEVAQRLGVPPLAVPQQAQG